MLHKPAATSGKDLAAAYKMRLGIWMFWPYAIAYGGFVAINLINPLLMEINVLGVNLATAYGFGLIVVALLEALVYDWLCRRMERKLNKPESKDKDGE